MIKWGNRILVAVSIVFSIIISCSALSVVSDLTKALVQLNFTSTLHRMEINQFLATKHNEIVEGVANTTDEWHSRLDNLATKLTDMQHQTVPEVITIRTVSLETIQK